MSRSPSSRVRRVERSPWCWWGAWSKPAGPICGAACVMALRDKQAIRNGNSSCLNVFHVNTTT
eukprot:3330399-Prymnesium_polylepis.1